MTGKQLSLHVLRVHMNLSTAPHNYCVDVPHSVPSPHIRQLTTAASPATGEPSSASSPPWEGFGKKEKPATDTAVIFGV